jgi:hypothetical protein
MGRSLLVAFPCALGSQRVCGLEYVIPDKNFHLAFQRTFHPLPGIAIYDGQTKEMLVYATQKGERSSGWIWTAQSSNDTYVTFDKASAEINRLMHDGDNAQERSK